MICFPYQRQQPSLTTALENEGGVESLNKISAQSIKTEARNVCKNKNNSKKMLRWLLPTNVVHSNMCRVFKFNQSTWWSTIDMWQTFFSFFCVAFFYAALRLLPLFRVVGPLIAFERNRKSLKIDPSAVTKEHSNRNTTTKIHKTHFICVSLRSRARVAFSLITFAPLSGVFQQSTRSPSSANLLSSTWPVSIVK
jgi:hypothetical protein